MAMTMMFEQVVETVRQFSPEQREMLADLMHRKIEASRHEIAKDARESLTAFRSGQFKVQSAKAVQRASGICERSGMRREIVLTPKFVRRNKKLQKNIEDTLEQMQENIFSASLSTHKLSGALEGLRACGCGYDLSDRVFAGTEFCCC